MDPNEPSHRQASTSQQVPAPNQSSSPDTSSNQPSASSTSRRTSGILVSPASDTDEKQPLVGPHPHFPSGPPAAPGEVPSAVRQSMRAISNQPLPPLPVHQSTIGSGVVELSPSRSHFLDPSRSHGHGSILDRYVPTVIEKNRPKTYEDRINPTLEAATKELEKYQWKAKITGYALNVAIGLQVLLGALVTGLSAVTVGRQTSIMTSILGGLSTVVASYLARARGSNEPELSIIRVKDLEQFIRECEAFKMDYGHIGGNDHDDKLQRLRDRFEELLGNANGERRLSTPV